MWKETKLGREGDRFGLRIKCFGEHKRSVGPPKGQRRSPRSVRPVSGTHTVQEVGREWTGTPSRDTGRMDLTGGRTTYGGPVSVDLSRIPLKWGRVGWSVYTLDFETDGR